MTQTTNTLDALLQDPKISWKAKGIAAYILSCGDRTRINQDELVRKARNGRESVRSALTELEKHGYIERKRERESGRYVGVNLQLINPNTEQI